MLKAGGMRTVLLGVRTSHLLIPFTMTVCMSWDDTVEKYFLATGAPRRC